MLTPPNCQHIGGTWTPGHTHMDGHTHTRTDTHTHNTHARTHARTHTHTHKRARTHTHREKEKKNAHAHKHTHTQTRTHTHTLTHKRARARTHTHYTYRYYNTFYTITGLTQGLANLYNSENRKAVLLLITEPTVRTPRTLVQGNDYLTRPGHREQADVK